MSGFSSYRLSGVLIASELALPAATAHDKAAPNTPATMGDPPIPPADPIVFRIAPSLSEVSVPADAWEERHHGVSVGRCRDGFVLRLPGCADFWIAGDGAAVVGAPVDGCPVETLAQLFLDQVLPLVLHARGTFSFHASSVALDGRDLVAFLGPAGAGKSTLASSLARVAPAVLFSDDCLAVEATSAGIVAYPSYASTRLWPESAGALFSDRGALPLASARTGKLRAALPAAAASMRLRRLYLVERGEGPPAVSRLGRRAALMRLAGNLYRLDAGDRARLAGELDLLEAVVSAVPVAVLTYRRAYDQLPAVREVILADLGCPPA
jgi:hypothetical protein